MTTVCRFAIIGAGGVAQSYAQAFEICQEARVVAVVDVRPEAGQALAERLRCATFPDVEALLHAGPDFDAAIICTPPNTHEAIAVTLLEHGIPVLCEKPFALDSRSARRMIDAARQHRTLLTMASKFRYVQDVIRAKSLLASGVIGEPILLENVFTARVDMSRRWNSQPAVSGGGVLIDNGTHAVDLMRYFLGPLAQVQAIEGKRLQGLAVEDTVRLFARTAEGVMASSDLSWSIHKECESFLSFYGSHGSLHVGWRESKYRLHSSREWIVFGTGYDKVRAFHDQIINFARALRGIEPLRINVLDALASVEVIEAAYESLHNSRWTPVGSSGPDDAPDSPNGHHRTGCADRTRDGDLGSCAYPARY